MSNDDCGKLIDINKKYLELKNCPIKNNNLRDLLLGMLQSPNALEYLEIKRISEAGNLELFKVVFLN